MTEDICQCPNCGRSHKPLGFGKPPESITSPHAELMQFYGVSTVADLIETQDKHIASLQSKVRSAGPPLVPGFPAYPVREG